MTIRIRGSSHTVNKCTALFNAARGMRAYRCFKYWKLLMYQLPNVPPTHIRLRHHLQ